MHTYPMNWEAKAHNFCTCSRTTELRYD